MMISVSYDLQFSNTANLCFLRTQVGSFLFWKKRD